VSIERRIALGIDVPLHEYQSLYAIFSGPFGDHHRALVLA